MDENNNMGEIDFLAVQYDEDDIHDDIHKYCYTLKVYFIVDQGISDSSENNELIEKQVEGANFVWGRLYRGVIVKVEKKIWSFPGNPPGDAYTIELTNSETLRDLCGGGSHNGKKIRLHIPSAKSNDYLLAHELGHLWGCPDEPVHFSVMRPSFPEPNLTYVLKAEELILKQFLESKTATGDRYIDSPQSPQNEGPPPPWVRKSYTDDWPQGVVHPAPPYFGAPIF